MSTEELNNEQKNIDEEVKRIAEQLNVQAVCDGVIWPKHYVMAPTKTAWVLREPHDCDGGWDYKQVIIERLTKNAIKRDKYFDPMRYLVYSLNNNLVPYEDIPFPDQDDDVAKLLIYTALINISKVIGGASVNHATFGNYVDKYSSLVKKQLSIANPKIIIASGTIEFFNKQGYLSNTSAHGKVYRKYYARESNIILDCYHLSQRTISQEIFCNDIICALRDAKSKGFLE